MCGGKNTSRSTNVQADGLCAAGGRRNYFEDQDLQSPLKVPILELVVVGLQVAVALAEAAAGGQLFPNALEELGKLIQVGDDHAGKGHKLQADGSYRQDVFGHFTQFHRKTSHLHCIHSVMYDSILHDSIR